MGSCTSSQYNIAEKSVKGDFEDSVDFGNVFAIYSQTKKNRNGSAQLYFKPFREGVVGLNAEIPTINGRKKLIYADWTATGRLYFPIERFLLNDIGPYVANTHSRSNFCGEAMTSAYEEAREIIKRHVNADMSNDVLISDGSGMTGAINRLQRLLGLKVPEQLQQYCQIPDQIRPLVIFFSPNYFLIVHKNY